MNIEMTIFDKDYLIPEDGKYLVRTESTHLKKIQHLEARCTRVFNNKHKRLETAVDVNNQRVTHISIEQVL